MEVRETNYLFKISKIIKEFLDKNLTFEEICQNSEGAFPTLVKDIVDNRCYKITNETIIYTNEPENIPEPHPIDYDWRFDDKSAMKLANYCFTKRSNILCVGTPSVFKYLINRNCHITLIDRNPHICNYYSKISDDIINIDFMQYNKKSILFDTIIMDPPWYTNVIKSWLLKSLKFSKVGTRIILPIIPKLVRPSANFERTDIFNLMNEIGFFWKLPFKIYYKTPLFEQETLSYYNLPQLLNWRVCDFIVLYILNNSTRRKFEYPLEYKWQRFIIGNQTIVLRKLIDDNGATIKVSSLYSDGSFILKSVSNNHYIRNSINLWTSRNRVMKVYGFKRIFSFLKEIELGGNPKHLISKFSNNNEELAALELIEKLIGV